MFIVSIAVYWPAPPDRHDGLRYPAMHRGSAAYLKLGVHPMEGYWFTSTLFHVEPGEDQEVNPGRYGRQLARWLQARLKEHGYSEAGVVAEDWGWCVMCHAQPFMLWVGCGNVESEASAEAVPIVWHCFAMAEVPFLARLFKRINAVPELSHLNSTLHTILGGTDGITLVSEP